MVLVKYIGDIFPTKVKLINSVLKIEKSGDLVEVPDEYVELLLKNKHFVLNGKKKEYKKSKNEAKKIDYDLNGDGVVDKKDASIAGKVLYETSKKEY